MAARQACAKRAAAAWCDGTVSELPVPPADLGTLCVELATGAAALVRDARRAAPTLSAATVSAKSTATDLVTDIDRASERWLTDRLASLRPDDAVLGEEGGAHPGRSGLRWLLDPIDGTVNFVLGIPYFAVSVAVEFDGHTVAGAVANPMTGEVFHAVRGGGAFVGDGTGELLGARRDVPLARAVVGTGFGYDVQLRQRQMAIAAELITEVADIRRLGAAALDLCSVAAGRLDAYFEADLHPWDHAAGGLIAAEAGCAASGLHGRRPGRRLYAVAGPALAPDFFALLERLGADTVTMP